MRHPFYNDRKQSNGPWVLLMAVTLFFALLGSLFVFQKREEEERPQENKKINDVISDKDREDKRDLDGLQVYRILYYEAVARQRVLPQFSDDWYKEQDVVRETAASHNAVLDRHPTWTFERLPVMDKINWKTKR